MKTAFIFGLAICQSSLEHSLLLLFYIFSTVEKIFRVCEVPVWISGVLRLSDFSILSTFFSYILLKLVNFLFRSVR